MRPLGCGNFGEVEDPTCAPFPTTLHEVDCQAEPPWMCGDMPSQTEMNDVSRRGPTLGGVLCCLD